MAFVLLAVIGVVFMPSNEVSADTAYIVTFDYNVSRIEKYVSSEILDSMKEYSVNVGIGAYAVEVDEKKPDVDIYKYYTYKWSVDGVIVDLNTYVVSANTKFVAVWSPVTYYITYSYPANVISKISNLQYGVTYTVESQRIDYYKPSLPHYAFIDWHTSDNFTADNITLYRPAGSIGDIVIYPEWTPIQYSINYNTDAENVDNPIYYDIESPNYSLSEPVKEGHIFKGWYYDPECTNLCSEIVCANGGNINLYPKWELVKYDITYILPNGEKQTIQAEYGKKASLPQMKKGIFDIIKTSESIDYVTSDMIVYVSIVNIWYVYVLALAFVVGIVFAIIIVQKKKQEKHAKLRKIYQSNLTKTSKRKGA